MTVPIGAISPNKYQPREVFDDESIDELRQSIEQKGVLQPLLVRGSPGNYELIAGERRLRAAKLAGLTEVPIQWRQVDDREALELAIIENVQRENLNPVEEARAYERLLDDFDMTQDDVATRVGKTRVAVTNTLRLLQLEPEILAKVESGELSAGHARALLALPGGEREKVVGEIRRRKLNVRDTEKLVRQRGARAESDADKAALEAALAQNLGTKVRIRGRGKNRGSIEIDFYSLDQLDGLIARLSQHPRAAASF